MSTLELREERATAPRAGGGRVVTSGDLCPGRPQGEHCLSLPKGCVVTVRPDSAPLCLADAWGRRRQEAQGFRPLPPPSSPGCTSDRSSGGGALCSGNPGLFGVECGTTFSLTSLGLSKAVLTVTHSLHLGTLSSASRLPVPCSLPPTECWGVSGSAPSPQPVSNSPLQVSFLSRPVLSQALPVVLNLVSTPP